MRPRIAKLFVDAVTEFMQTMAGLGCTITPIVEVDRSGGQLSGVITLLGDAFGQVVVSFSRESAARLVARVMGNDPSKLEDETLCDGVGEITNVIAGNAIGALSQLGFELRLSLPSTVSADDQVHSLKFDWTAHYEIQNPLGAYLLSVGLNLK